MWRQPRRLLHFSNVSVCECSDDCILFNSGIKSLDVTWECCVTFYRKLTTFVCLSMVMQQSFNCIGNLDTTLCQWGILAIVLIYEYDRAVFICVRFQDICFLWVWPHLIICTNIITVVVFVCKYDLGFVNIDFFLRILPKHFDCSEMLTSQKRTY